MSIVDGINRLIGIVLDVFRQFGRGRIWFWLLLYSIISFIVLYAHYDFLSPIFYPIISFWTGLLGEKQSTGFSHYPGHFLLMPYYWEWARLVLSVVIEGLFLGAASVLFYERFVRVDEEDRFAFGQMIRSWIHLSLAFVVLNGLVLAVGWAASNGLASFLAYSPRRQFVFEWLALPFLFMIVLGLFFFTIPVVAVYRENIVRAIGRSAKLFIRNPITVLVMAGIVLAGPVVVSNIANSPSTLVDKFKPELVFWILLGGLVIDLIASFLWMGMAVRFLVDEEE